MRVPHYSLGQVTRQETVACEEVVVIGVNAAICRATAPEIEQVRSRRRRQRRHRNPHPGGERCGGGLRKQRSGPAPCAAEVLSVPEFDDLAGEREHGALPPGSGSAASVALATVNDVSHRYSPLLAL